jgi:hypothetical protein
MMISSHTGKMRKTGSAPSNSCPAMIQTLGSLLPTSSGAWSANLTNTRSLALLGDPDASAYELLFSFSSPEEKTEFLDLIRSNEHMGNDYIDFMSPTVEEIKVERSSNESIISITYMRFRQPKLLPRSTS